MSMSSKKESISSSSSYTTINEECPICLDPMSKSDIDHPLLCNKKCGYNFCVTCIEHLIKSSESDTEMASDGNMAVKIRLQCPQCRSDLRISIHDTLLLRKVHSMQVVLTTNDSMLTASELRMKHSWDEGKVMEAVEVAQRREEGFLKNGICIDEDKDESKEETTAADNTSPSSSSNKSTAPPILSAASFEKTNNNDDLFVDVALFRGMQFAMTMEEQHFVTVLMTSGNASQLAQAAEILKSIGVMSRQGVTPSMRSANHNESKPPPPPPTPPRRQQRATPPTPHRRNQRATSSTTNLRSGRSSSVAVGRAMALTQPPSSPAMAAANKKERMKQAKISSFNKLNPLPTRMPLYCVTPTKDFIIPRARTYPILFKDENNDRVVIAQVKAPCNRYGIMRGDVITHVNGEEFNGTADVLMTTILLCCSEDENDDVGFNFVVNADQETADKLQLRASLLQALLSEL